MNKALHKHLRELARNLSMSNFLYMYHDPFLDERCKFMYLLLMQNIDERGLCEVDADTLVNLRFHLGEKLEEPFLGLLDRGYIAKSVKKNGNWNIKFLWQINPYQKPKPYIQ